MGMGLFWKADERMHHSGKYKCRCKCINVIFFHFASVNINQCYPLINFKSTISSADRTEIQENASEKYNFHYTDTT